MNHVLYGASIPFLVGVALYVLRGYRADLRLLIVIPLAMTFMAVWAVAPDLPRALGHQGLYNRLASDPRMDIFLWHYSLDQMETSPNWHSVLEIEAPWQTVGVALEAAALMGVAIRHLFIKEKQ